MKKDKHPDYREVVFLDMSTDKKFICRSVVNTADEIVFEGKKYPCVKVSISSDSHPFYTGDQKFVDTEGRIDKFKKRYLKKAEPIKEIKEEEDNSKEISKKVVKKLVVSKKPTKK